MLKAILFDCDGVIVNSEPTHLKAFQMTLAAEGISLTEEEYYQSYLAMDDKGFFEAILAARDRIPSHRAADKRTLKRLILQKKALYQALCAKGAPLGDFIYPGVYDFVKRVEGKYKLAIASGAFRSEIKWVLDQARIRSAFPVIVSAQDVRQGKPHPESFLTALLKLNHLYRPHPLIAPHECVVIEDSIHGIKAARAARMMSIAVTHSYPRETFDGMADGVIASFEELTQEKMEAICRTN